MEIIHVVINLVYNTIRIAELLVEEFQAVCILTSKSVINDQY